MLDKIDISDFSLLRSTSVVLGNGLTCISGESGAGKSLLLDAIAFACGGRTHRNLLAHGATSCTVALSLRIDDDHAAVLPSPWKAGENLIERRYSSNGRSQASVNDVGVRTSELHAACSRMIEVTGQFESATLFNSSTHLGLLDAFGGTTLTETAARYAELYGTYRDLAQRLATLAATERNREQELDYLRFQVAELKQANVTPGERSEVESALRLQQHSGELLRHVSTARQLLSGSEDSQDAYSLAALAQRELRASLGLLGGTINDRNVDEADISQDSPAGLVTQGCELLEAALAQLQEAASLAQQFCDDIQFDPQAAETAAARLNDLLRLEKKYGISADDLPGLLEQLQERLTILSDESHSPAELERQMVEVRDQLLKSAAVLTRLRKQAAVAMQRATSTYFTELEFPNCELQVELTDLEEPGAHGLDSVELLISLNPGEPPRPLVQVASGGEASRLLLGLKAALADKLRFSVILLDEIEAGLGGRTAQAVAEVMLKLAAGRQVIAITHLPIVAAAAAQHLVVRKEVVSGRTVTQIFPVTGEERRHELARMLGGAGSAEELALADQMLAGSYQTRTAR
jgi:DNA repair protein RecN (Recombination protein N)